jgi:hypothetical protein
MVNDNKQQTVGWNITSIEYLIYIFRPSFLGKGCGKGCGKFGNSESHGLKRNSFKKFFHGRLSFSEP